MVRKLPWDKSPDPKGGSQNQASQVARPTRRQTIFDPQPNAKQITWDESREVAHNPPLASTASLLTPPSRAHRRSLLDRQPDARQIQWEDPYVERSQSERLASLPQVKNQHRKVPNMAIRNHFHTPSHKEGNQSRMITFNQEEQDQIMDETRQERVTRNRDNRSSLHSPEACVPEPQHQNLPYLSNDQFEVNLRMFQEWNSNGRPPLGAGSEVHPTRDFTSSTRIRSRVSQLDRSISPPPVSRRLRRESLTSLDDENKFTFRKNVPKPDREPSMASISPKDGGRIKRSSGSLQAEPAPKRPRLPSSYQSLSPFSPSAQGSGLPAIPTHPDWMAVHRYRLNVRGRKQAPKSQTTVREILTFRREPDNPFDPNAISVHNASNVLAGYLPRADAARLAPYLDTRRIRLTGQTIGRGKQSEWLSKDARIEVTIQSWDMSLDVDKLTPPPYDYHSRRGGGDSPEAMRTPSPEVEDYEDQKDL